MIVLSHILTNLEAVPLKQQDGKDITLRDVVINALTQDDPRAQVNGDERFKRFQLALRVHSATETIDLSAEDVALIKRLVMNSPFFNIVAIGRAVDALEGRGVVH